MAPQAWAASSTRVKPLASARFVNSSRSTGCPAISTPIMALVRGVIFVDTSSGSMFKVSGCMSAKTGVAPVYTTAWTVETKVIGVTITSSPGERSREAMARWSAAVQEFKPTQNLAPTFSANFFSNSSVFGPRPIHPERMVSTTDAISSSVIDGFKTGIYSPTFFAGFKVIPPNLRLQWDPSVYSCKESPTLRVEKDPQISGWHRLLRPHNLFYNIADRADLFPPELVIEGQGQAGSSRPLGLRILPALIVKGPAVKGL